MFSTGRVIVLIVLAAVFLISPPTRAERIRTAVPGLNLNYLSVFTAEERGFFRNEGLENETIVIGGPAGIAALVSGDVDYSGAGGKRAPRGRQRGAAESDHVPNRETDVVSGRFSEHHFGL